MDRLIGLLFLGLGMFLLVALLAGLFVYLPVSLSAQASCLEAGYPRAYVTWNLNRYCANLEGNVTVSVKDVDALGGDQ
jgi:hypothetical protein